MKNIILILLIIVASNSFAQENQRLSTFQIIQILDNNIAEAEYYYENNWQVLREMAIKKEYIHSYQLFLTPENGDHTTEMILITTYRNENQYEKREEHFQELIKEKGELKLLNDKQPGEFRKSIMVREQVRSLN